MFKGIITRLVLMLALAVVSSFAAEAAEVQMSFHGNQYFLFVSTDGKVILINPKLKTTISQHVRYKGRYPWMGTGKRFEAEVKNLGLNVNVLIPKPGKVYTLSK